MLAILQFTAPALLLGVVVAALPVLIHLLLRPRPRRVWFPGVAFLHARLASGQRAQRLRNFWLLLLRVLALVAIAVLLAGPTCTPTARTGDLHEPVACALLVDDSWSMRYRLDEDTTLLDQACSAGRELTRVAADWPQASALALIWTDPEKPATELLTDYSAIAARLRAPRESVPNAATLSHGLRVAARLLQAARQPVRRLVVFTDQAAHAWRDVPPGLLTGIDNLEVSVRSFTAQPRTNIALTAAGGPSRLHPESSPVPIEATLEAAGLDATCFLTVRDGEQVLDRIGPLSVSADTARNVSLMLPPQPLGAHALTLEIEPDDRLNFDQSRYLVYQTTQRPLVWLLTPADATPDRDLTALLLRNLLAPETLQPQQQQVALRLLVPEDLAKPPQDESAVSATGPADERSAPNLIVVTGGAELNEAARQLLRGEADRGATVLLLPGSRTDAVTWPGLDRLLTRTVQGVETLDAITSFSWEPGSALAGQSDELDQLTRTSVRRRLRLAGLQDGVTVEARYSDGVPAIVSSRRGRGRIFLLTTAPDPEWSDLGTRAAGLLTWLHELLHEALGPADAAAMFTAGVTSRFPFAGLPAEGSVRVTQLTHGSDETVSVELVDGEPKSGWPTAQPGIYALTPPGTDKPRALYAVNWPAQESDLRPITADRLKTLLGVTDVKLEAEGAPADGNGQPLLARLLGPRGASRVLAFVLLVLLAGELLLAFRGRGSARGN